MALSQNTSAIALSAATAILLTFSGCGGGGGGTGTTVNTDTNTTTDVNTTTTSTLLYDGAGAADVQVRYEANDATYTAVPAPAYDAANISVLTGDITVDTTLTADKQWDVQGLVKVKNGATLTVEPGTVVFGDAGANYIVVTQGSKIIADGTKDAPIIFTSKMALMNPAAADVGQWGGLTLLGKAPTNHASPFYEVDETDPDFAFGNATMGAGDANDNSGILRNVYIMNSGYTVATDLEINGLSLAGVGAGTLIDDVTVINSSDDCIEIWGGTVDVSNLAMINCQDDSFDLDYGYSGHATNIFVQQKEIAHAGFEISSGGDTPMTMAKISNFSINKVNGSDEGGIYIKDDTTAPEFVNGLISTMGATDAAFHTKKLFSATQKAVIAFNDVTVRAETLYDGAGAADVQVRYEANDATYTAVPAPAYDAANISVLTGDITVDTTLTADKQWDVQGLVKVKNGATLTVEPGTVVFGDAGANYIVVTQGSKIIADGTKDAPIIFTSKMALMNPAAADVGQWGGLTLLGKAPTNHASPFYEVDETDPDFAFGNATMGAGDANDNSGILRNVYIMNSGYTVATDLEINGLSLAGVGAGTLIDDVTVINSSDDCIEIWGGTVDVSNLAMINCQDDSFDLDYGYSGHATNIFVQQKEIAHAGFEISSGGDTPMTMAKISNFSINKVNGSDEGGIYIKDDTTAPAFVNGLISRLTDTDAAFHTKKLFSTLQKATISFKDVTAK
ncbi:hypothetical protein WCX18_09820 [Sulfurimonas sp. HSL1-2]|uniref:hypothetical protein n=1 Tax=Thiomicrolovo zhangzhouensis TaxID=3131933 RepID=UPI0031F8ED3A